MKFWRIFTTAVILLTFGHQTPAQTYPSRAIRIIVPYQAGQGTDVATRFLAEHLGKALAQPVIVENKAGAGGNIGAAEASRAAPDGYTLVMGTNGTHVLNQFLYSAMPFNPERDFVPIGLVSTFPMVLLTHPASGFSNLADVITAAKQKSTGLDAAVPSTTARLVLELLAQSSGTAFQAIPYKGSSASMADLIGRQVPLAIDTISAAKALITSGKIKPLGVTSLKESALLPGVKSVAEQGQNGFLVLAWNGLYAPRGTPGPIVERLNTELAKLLAQASIRERMLELGHEPAGGSSSDLAGFAVNERSKWGPLINRIGLKAE